ncbi:MAG: hypothetical protein DRJ98_00400 [Thermoprotei archaeon]|nr:MAG: hypothetical protein DRJ98_00400 [Thermoprotei archaeon]
MLLGAPNTSRISVWAGASFMEWTSTVKLLICVACLSYASWSDIKTREVSDKVWVIMAAFTAPITIMEVAWGRLPLLLLVLSLGLCFIIGLAAFYVGLFGGADAEALWCLGIALPAYPKLHPWMSQPLMGLQQPIFSLSIFSNTVVLAASTAIYVLLRNLLYKARGKPLFQGLEEETFPRKAIALFIGYKVDASKLSERSHVFIMETMRGEKRRLKLFFSSEKEDFGLSEEKKSELTGEVWVAPALPLLAYMMIGLAMALFIGDLVSFITLQILSFLQIL